MKHIWIKSLSVIAVLLTAISCSPTNFEEVEDPKPWEGINLPVAEHFLKKEFGQGEVTYDDPMRGIDVFINITVEKTGGLRLNGCPCNTTNIVHYYKSCVNRYGDSKSIVTLYADSNTLFKDFWRPIKALRKIGFWKPLTAAFISTPQEPSVIGTSGFAVPVLEKDDANGVIISEEVTALEIKVKSEEILVNNAVFSPLEFDTHIRAHSNKLHSAFIVIVPAEESSYAELIRILNILGKYNCGNLSIMEEYTGKYLKQPYPDIELLLGMSI